MHSNFKQQLIKLNACKESIDWVGDRTFEQAYNDCHRGDWLLWLYAITADLTIDANHRLLILTKAKCANTVRHLMKDVKSTEAVDIAIAYGKGKDNVETLAAAYANAYGAYAAAYSAYIITYGATAYGAYLAAGAASVATYGGYVADYGAYVNYGAYAANVASAVAFAAASAASVATYFVNSADVAAYVDANAVSDAMKENQKLTAEIVRSIITIDKFSFYAQ
jgi:hypothetical protein